MTKPKKNAIPGLPDLAAEERAELAALLRRPTCLVGVGNPLRRDDGLGPWIVGAVRPALAKGRLGLVDAQDVPENFVPGLAHGAWANVVFIDAVSAAKPPGSIVFGPLSGFGEIESFSTHKLALSFSGKYLEAAGKKAFLLGVVPGDLAFGAGFTPEVERSARALRDFIIRAAASAAD